MACAFMSWISVLYYDNLEFSLKTPKNPWALEFIWPAYYVEIIFGKISSLSFFFVQEQIWRSRICTVSYCNHFSFRQFSLKNMFVLISVCILCISGPHLRKDCGAGILKVGIFVMCIRFLMYLNIFCNETDDSNRVNHPVHFEFLLIWIACLSNGKH